MKRLFLGLGTVVAVSCALEAIDYDGKACTDGFCPEGYACLQGQCVQSVGGGPAGGAAAGSGGGGTAGGGTAGGGTAGGGTSGGGTSGGGTAGGGTAGGGTAGGGTAGGGTAGGGTMTMTFFPETDADDVLWVGGYDADGGPPVADDERLFYTVAEPYIEVGDDNENCDMGLRFLLPIPRSAQIFTATLTLQRVAGSSGAMTMRVTAYDVGDAPIFSASHTHPATQHATVLSASVSGWVAPTTSGTTTTSPELASLVQQVVNRTDWPAAGDSHIGFVVLAQSTNNDWVGFGDTHGVLAADRPRLTVTWR